MKEEEIIKASENDANYEWKPNSRDRSSFEIGAKWALNNQWTYVMDKLPETTDGMRDSDLVLVKTRTMSESGYTIHLAYLQSYGINHKMWKLIHGGTYAFVPKFIRQNSVTHWMPIPKLIK